MRQRVIMPETSCFVIPSEFEVKSSELNLQAAEIEEQAKACTQN
jgi:hypothetical protein